MPWAFGGDERLTYDEAALIVADAKARIAARKKAVDKAKKGANGPRTTTRRRRR